MNTQQKLNAIYYHHQKAMNSSSRQTLYVVILVLVILIVSMLNSFQYVPTKLTIIYIGIAIMVSWWLRHLGKQQNKIAEEHQRKLIELLHQ